MAKRNARKIALFVFSLGFSLLIVGVAWLLVERSLISVPDETSVATVDLAEGDVTITRKATMLEIKPRFGEKIYNADKIKTGANSALIFATRSSSQIRVDENSVVIMEQSRNKDLVTVLKGQAQAIKHGGSLEIQNTHEKWRIALISTQISKSEVTQKPAAPPVADPAPSSPLPKPAPSETTELSADEQNLKSTLEGQKTYFNKCFAKFLVQNPEARGEIVLGFLLFPQGKAEKVKVLSASLKDNDLERCLTSVVERSPFKRFAGEPISVTYPIRFE